MVKWERATDDMLETIEGKDGKITELEEKNRRKGRKNWGTRRTHCTVVILKWSYP